MREITPSLVAVGVYELDRGPIAELYPGLWIFGYSMFRGDGERARAEV